MKLIYSGKTKDFTPELEERIVSKLSKLSKFIEQRGEREAHVAHCVERHLRKVEIVVNFYDHSLIGEGADPDLETALCQAMEKLETQAAKLRSRWRDTHRDPKSVRSTKENWEQSFPDAGSAAANLPAKPGVNGSRPRKPRVFRVNYDEDSKPMTLEEAVIEMENQQDYVVYRDASKNRLSVLVRRADGHFDLIES